VEVTCSGRSELKGKSVHEPGRKFKSTTSKQSGPATPIPRFRVCGILLSCLISLALLLQANHNSSRREPISQRRDNRMVRLREIPRTAAFAWAPGADVPLIVTGTRAGAVDAEFSDETKLELWELGLDNIEQGVELQPMASINTDSR
jgi:hypothetical protein